ncbi:MAG: ABC transporter permease [Clostridia bacterium]|nr:ABC transporter permease [Clostridia bacterium]
MMLYQSFKMALKAIAGNKMRSFLTMLGVIIGVMAVVVLVAIGQGANSSVVESIEGMGTNLITANITARRMNPVDMDGLNELAQNPFIEYTAPLANVSGTVKAGNTTYDDGSVMGTTPGYEHIRGWTVAEGRFLTQPDIDNRSFVAVIGAEAATEMYGTTHAVGETFSLSGYTITVVGVLQANGESASGSNDNQVIIPFSLAQRLSNSTSISSFYVSAVSSDAVVMAQLAVENFLEKAFENYTASSWGTQYSVYNQTEMLDTLSETTETLTLMLGGIAAISLLVGGIGIMNIMLVSVSERTREIGIRKAIGAARGNILMQFLIESLVVSLMGGVLGLGLSVLAVDFLAPILDMTLEIPVNVAWLAIAFSVVIGVVFGMYPASKASKLKPIDALHYEG